VAKKSSVSSPGSKAAESGSRKQPAKPAIAKESVAKGSTSRQPASAAAPGPAKQILAQDEIGSVAGLVWQTLSEQGDQSVAALKKAVGAPDDLVLAAIGWLAREGKLNFDASNRTLKISLR
jgi:hypothetical protein